MPVRSLNSPVLKWPDAQEVKQAARIWARKMARQHPTIIGIGYFGSYARGDWGVGSDLDLVIVVTDTELAFAARAAQWDTTSLPVPADVLVYTRTEWGKLCGPGRFGRILEQELKWLVGGDFRA